MTTVVLDTNIVSHLFKHDSRATLYAPHLLNRELTIAMMTVDDYQAIPGLIIISEA